MGEVIANNLNSFSDSILNFEQTCRSLEQDQERVIRLMKSLNKMWSGQAHDTLLERFQKDQRMSEETMAVMREILADLKNASEEYQRGEENVSSIVASVRI